MDTYLTPFLGWIDAVDIEPAIPIRSPAFENVFWHGVRSAPRDEDHTTILRPVRQSSLGDEQFVVWIKETHVVML
ncbi:MAG: hypothetical protein NTV80_15415 [Verrucomicrobia bacterium]|nr:hypothetical protein [Verrucomicrobiota bacterium]